MSEGKTHVKLHNPNVTLGSVLAVQKWDFGINPNVMDCQLLGLIPMSRKRGIWELSLTFKLSKLLKIN